MSFHTYGTWEKRTQPIKTLGVHMSPGPSQAHCFLLNPWFAGPKPLTGFHRTALHATVSPIRDISTTSSNTWQYGDLKRDDWSFQRLKAGLHSYKKQGEGMVLKGCSIYNEARVVQGQQTGVLDILYFSNPNVWVWRFSDQGLMAQKVKIK